MSGSSSIKKLVVIFTIILVFVVAGLSWMYIHFQQERSTNQVSVSLHGIASAELIKTEDNSVVRQVNNNDTLSLDIGENYIIRYTGSEGFADGESSPIDTYESEIKVAADYSKQRLDKLHASEKASIDQVLKGYFINLTEQYSLDEGELFVRGDWYGVVLNYKGQALTDRDDVVLVLYKEANTWRVVTDPPLPSVTLRDGAELQVPRQVRQAMNQKILLSN